MCSIERIKDATPDKAEDLGRICSGNHRFVKAVMWIAKTGTAFWRDLPLEYGKWGKSYFLTVLPLIAGEKADAVLVDK